MSWPDLPAPKARGAHANPPNRFGGLAYEPDPDELDNDAEYRDSLRNLPTEYFPDYSRSIVTENQSPDIGFRFSINPYRGCAHGCSYCYARPTHEYLGLSAGLDFETKVFVKEDAPELFREFLNRPGWRAEPIALSGVTDCYQPAERHYRLTRRLLEVAVEARQPVIIVTKNALIVRDIDLLRTLAAARLVHVCLSVTTLDASLARSMEPRTSIPAARLRAMSALAEVGIPVAVLIAPVIPGLNDSEIPALLAAAKAAGARAAGYVLLRLPLTVAPLFMDWLERTQPQRAAKILGRVRSTRGGKLNTAQFGLRMRGTGKLAEQIRGVFQLFEKKHRLDGDLPELDSTHFRPPLPPSGQGLLF
jgi:DNA repair photolyase